MMIEARSISAKAYADAPSLRQVLGVAARAPGADVRRRFRQLAPLVHPDKCAAPRAEDAFKLLGSAVTRLLTGADGCV